MAHLKPLKEKLMLSTWRHSFEEINETQLIYLLLS